ncbi:Tn3 family transposase [Klebsiella pneumoniae]
MAASLAHSATKPIRRPWPSWSTHQYRHAFAAHWGDGTTSSSDGQRFRAGGRGESTGHVNPKYGSEPGRLFYNPYLRPVRARSAPAW